MMLSERRRQTLAGIIFSLLLWMLIGGIFVPLSLCTLASSLPSAGTHQVCVCKLCKGGTKKCCCTAAVSDTICSGCDAADEEGIRLATAQALLPGPVDVVPSPFITGYALALSVQTEILSSRLPVPLLTPPKHLS